jgi:hypothetical protein
MARWQSAAPAPVLSPSPRPSLHSHLPSEPTQDDPTISNGDVMRATRCSSTGSGAFLELPLALCSTFHPHCATGTRPSRASGRTSKVEGGQTNPSVHLELLDLLRLSLNGGSETAGELLERRGQLVKVRANEEVAVRWWLKKGRKDALGESDGQHGQ